MNRIVLASLFICLTLGINAQSFSPIQLPVKNGSIEYLYPFAGGVQAPQFSQVDLNFDGALDLFVFDRSGDVKSAFIYEDGEYIYSPEYLEGFPKLRSWVKLIDYNNDDIPDIFCAPSITVFNGIEVWVGRRENSKLYFDLKVFDQFFHDGLYFELGDDSFNVYVPTDDYPIIEDVNGDGDIDVISFGTGGSQLWYYENQVIERGLAIDTFSFELTDDCYGGVFESEVNENLFLSETINGCANDIVKDDDDSKSGGAHAGSTLLNIDANNDGLQDLLIGDLSNNFMTLAYNGGFEDNAWFVEQDIRFPVYDETIEMPFFLASYKLDYDFDGDLDIIATCNRRIGVTNTNNTWLFEKTSTTNEEPFQLVTKSFITDEMIDLGENASVSFIDVDQDGLMDIVASSSGEYITNAISNTSMAYLRNVGSKEVPMFELVDNDWLGFSQFKEFSKSIKTGFGDLDGDGDTDLIIGDRVGELYYYENIAGIGQPFEFANPVAEYAGIDVGNFAKPILIDLDQDGLADLLIGEEGTNSDPEDPEIRSSLNFFKNIGTLGNPQFDYDLDSDINSPIIGQVVTTTPFQSRASCAPYIVEAENETLLFVGSESGEIDVYNNFIGNLDGAFDKVIDDLYDVNVGRKSTPALYDIDNDGFLEMLIGNERGGLNLFSTDIASKTNSTSEESAIDVYSDIYPNPAEHSINISSSIEFTSYIIYNTSGQVLKQGIFSPTIKLDEIPSGLYIIQLNSGNETVSKRFVKV